ncbi:hypothetical protein KR009_009794 [Drosophila setifemur]|nr:hypothetical protein KR009_009794 [Drosophila setifemur]
MNLCKNSKLLRNLRQLSLAARQIHTLEPLANRELIRVRGSEVVPFLQGLVTNDVSRIQQSSSASGPTSQYTLFLNKSGRVLYDSIIYRTSNPDTFLLECDREASAEFQRHLRTYRVRKRIDIDSVDEELKAWVLFGPQIDAPTDSKMIASTDPRLPALGTRILAPADLNREKIIKGIGINALSPTPEHNYQLLRYKQGVGEGSQELPAGKCFPLEANADYLHGVSFQKGCYVGQELTARIHHSGVIRKRYMPIRLTAPLSANRDVTSIAGAKLGRVLGAAQDHGVALLRIEQVLNGQELMLDGEPCFADRPLWWPEETPGKRRQVCE